jgi:transcription-repair coupling factor (superfamily II helicase)
VLEQQLQSRHIVEFGYRPHLASFEIEFKTRIQPAFNRQFDY